MSEAPIPSRIEEICDRRPRWRAAILIGVLALTVNLAGNGRTSLWDRDEPRYAGCTREMIARGDWLHPTFNGEPRYHKPILIYWLMRIGFLVGGDTPFGARLVSSIAGAGTCLVVLGLGRRMLGERAGFLSALMLASAPIMVIESKLATTDAALTFFLVGAQACLWELHQRASRRVALGFWALLALAMLTKGPVGPALIACAGLASWCFHGPKVIWQRLEWKWGLVLFLLIAGPWYVAIGILTDGDFYRFAVGKQIAARITSGLDDHEGFPGYYLITSCLTFHPWSALIPMAVVAAWARRKADPRLGFLLGWIVGPLVLLELVRTKLVHYYLPAYPACALAAAWLVGELSADGVNLRRWPLGRLALEMLGGVGLGVAVVALAGGLVLPAGLRGPCLTIAVVAASGTLWGLLRFQHAEAERAVLGLALTWSLVMLVLGGWLLPSAEPYRLTRLVGQRLGALARAEDAEPVLLKFQEPTIIHAMGRHVQMIRSWAAFDELLDQHGSLSTALLPEDVREFGLRSDEYTLDLRDTIAGFNFNKGREQTIRLAILKRRRKPELARKPPSDPMLERTSGEKLLVK